MAEEAAARENEYLDLFNLTPPFWFAGEIPDETTNKQNKENKKRRNHQAE